MNEKAAAASSSRLIGRGDHHLKLRRHHGSSSAASSSSSSASRLDCMLDRVECGGVSTSPHHGPSTSTSSSSSSSSSSSPSPSSYSDDDSEYKKDDDHCGLGSTLLSSPSSSSAPADRHNARHCLHRPNNDHRGPEWRRTPTSTALLRIAASSAVLFVLPLLLWDSRPDDWDLWNPLPLVRHGGLVWDSVLQFSAWPVVLSTLLIAALSPATTGGGGGSSTQSSPGSAKDNAAAPPPPPPAPNANANAVGRSADGSATTRSDGISNAWSGMARSDWKMPLLISIVFSSLVVGHMTMQMVAPHMIWNPFLWGYYRVYLPEGTSGILGRACLDGGALLEDRERGGGGVGGSRSGNNDNLGSDVAESSFGPPPLCLAELDWNELSSGQLSSHDPDDVVAVEHGLDYLRNRSGGLVVSVLARNVADSIPALRQNMDGLATLFQGGRKGGKNRLSLVVFENDSSDGTREAFRRWSDEESGRTDGPRYAVDVAGCGPRNPDCRLGIVDRYDVPLTTATASGVGRLGEFRQILMEYVLGKEEYREYSHMIVLDADLGVSLSPLGLLHTLGVDDGRVAMDHAVASSSVQVWPGTLGTMTPPYDFSAFRPMESESNRKVRGLHRRFCELMPPGDRWRNLCDASSPMQLFMIQSANDVSNHRDRPYEVASAFNGLTMYPLGLVRGRGSGARYDAGEDGQRCEHIGFHLSLRETMYVNPKWKMNLRPERPGGPSGVQAIKTLIYAIVGRPAIVALLVLSKICCFYVIVSACWIIFTTVGRMWRSCPEIWGVFVSLGQQVCRGNIRCLFIDVKMGSNTFDMRETREKE